MALSFALHGLALAPLLLAGASGSTPVEEAATLVEISLAAPAPSPDSNIDLPTADDPPPPVDASEIVPTTVELPPPEEPPPPVDSADLKPIEPPPPPPPPKPQATPTPQPKPALPKPAARPAMTQTASPPDAGTAEITQSAAAPAAAIVWEHHPRFRTPPKPAVYPPRAIELGQQGEAMVRVRLDTSGEAVEILLHRGTGHELLDKAALAAVRGWHFMPAMRGGHAVAAWVEIPVRFHLR